LLEQISSLTQLSGEAKRASHSKGEFDMSTFEHLFAWHRRQQKSLFTEQINPQFPPIEELIQKAEKTTQSCRLYEQVDVTNLFYKKVAMRGVNNQRYSPEEAQKVGIIIDYLADIRRKQLTQADAV